MPLIAKRYAEALLILSDEKSWFERSLDNLKAITKAYLDTLDLRNMLDSPEIKIHEKKTLIAKIFNNFDKQVVNFVLLLIDKGRINFLPHILDEYIILTNKLKKVLDIEIISSEKLTPDQIKNIENKYKKLYNENKINSIQTIDKSLIGGVKVIIGDKIYDDSIKSHLQKLKTIINLT